MRTLTLTAVTVLALAAAAVPAQAAWPGSPGRIAFVQGDVGGVLQHGIATAMPDGSDQKIVGPTCQEGLPAPCPGNPAWSRDGKKLAFDLAPAIGTMDADGSNVHTFTEPGLTGLSRPAWDPTGTRVAFQAVDAQGLQNLYIANADGSSLRKLTFGGGSEPAWSVDDRIAFVRSGNVFVVGSDGKGLRRITGKGGTQPNWSPYASQLAFVRSRNIYRVHDDATRPLKLTGKGGYEPAWSTTGERIFFHRISGGNRFIYSVDLDAGGLVLATGGVEGRIHNVNSVDQQPLPTQP